MFLAPLRGTSGGMIVTLSRFKIVLAGLSAIIFFAWSGSVDRRAMAQGVKRPIGLGSTTSANAELEKEVSAKLANNDQLMFAKLSVTADVTKNQITLAGELPSDALRTTAVELAKSAQVGLIVNDQITVKTKVLPEESKGGGARPNR